MASTTIQNKARVLTGAKLRQRRCRGLYSCGSESFAQHLRSLPQIRRLVQFMRFPSADPRDRIENCERIRVERKMIRTKHEVQYDPQDDDGNDEEHEFGAPHARHDRLDDALVNRLTGFAQMLRLSGIALRHAASAPVLRVD